MSEEKRQKLLHIALSLAIRALVWAFNHYGEEAEERAAVIIEKRYGIDARPLLNEVRVAVTEFEETHPVAA